MAEAESKLRVLVLCGRSPRHLYVANALCGAADVVAMCRSLTGMMRYVTNSDPMTTLGEEISYVSRYLYCMQIRYEDSLSYTIDVPEELMGEPVPRLIIQPFVENALKYGGEVSPA